MSANIHIHAHLYDAMMFNNLSDLWTKIVFHHDFTPFYLNNTGINHKVEKRIELITAWVKNVNLTLAKIIFLYKKVQGVTKNKKN